MASALSEDEFHRMQLQLIELRTNKYELEALNKKHEREIQTIKEANENADKELQKALKVITKSKKAKETELLIQENDSLQLKLHSQEEDFRIQNETLMQELNKLVSANEDLEKQLTNVKQNGAAAQARLSLGDVSHLEDEIRRLQAQNLALQKTISGLQVKACHVEEDKNNESTSKDPPKLTSMSSNDEKIDVREELQHEINKLQLNLDTESEEKRILKEELFQKDENYAKEVKALKDELEKVNEKFQKKQESYLQLQQEKESLFKETNTKVGELHANKDRDQKYYTDQIGKLQQEIAKYQRLQSDIQSSSDQTIKQLQNKMTAMQHQIEAADIIESQHLQEKANKYESIIKDLKKQILLLTQKRDELQAQLEESWRINQEESKQYSVIQHERDQHFQALQESIKLANSRKGMLDNFAIDHQKDCDKYREQLMSMEKNYKEKIKSLEMLLEQEKKKYAELEKLRAVVEEQQVKLSSLEEKKGWLERTLEETESILTKTRLENETAVIHLKAEHEEEMDNLKTSHSTQVNDLTITFQKELETLKESEGSQMKTIQRLEEEIVKLKKKIEDAVNERKIHENKGKSMLKDLQKQLQSERKRAERLQERLQELLSSGSPHNKSIEDFLKSGDMSKNDSWMEDHSSVSSWSGVGTSYPAVHNALSTSTHSSPMSPNSELPSSLENGGCLERENKELLSRLASIQQQKWDLEEKVQHLETSTAAMANDLIEKARIIEHYVMDSRTDRKQHQPADDRITLKKVLDLVNKTEDQGLKEMNKKLQNMLEETLTKNMHLQKNLETLSQEIVCLSKLPHQNTDTSVTLSTCNCQGSPTLPTSSKCLPANGTVS